MQVTGSAPVANIPFCVIMIKNNILHRKDGENGGKMKKSKNNSSLLTAYSSKVEPAGVMLISSKSVQKTPTTGMQATQHITYKINSNIRNFVESAIKMGNELISVKELLTDCEEWRKWLFNEVDISEEMAENYMKVAQMYPDPKSLSPLEMSKAFELISLYIFAQ